MDRGGPFLISRVWLLWAMTGYDTPLAITYYKSAMTYLPAITDLQLLTYNDRLQVPPGEDLLAPVYIALSPSLQLYLNANFIPRWI